MHLVVAFMHSFGRTRLEMPAASHGQRWGPWLGLQQMVEEAEDATFPPREQPEPLSSGC